MNGQPFSVIKCPAAHQYKVTFSVVAKRFAVKCLEMWVLQRKKGRKKNMFLVIVRDFVVIEQK
jgi:hypothetical protein